MKRFSLSAAGLAAAAITGVASADISVNFSTGPLGAGQGIVIDLGGPITGTLTSILADINFVNMFGDSSWAADMLVAISDGTSLFSCGGYNLVYGGTYIGSWDSGSSSASGFYSMNTNGGGAMNGGGFVGIANGYSGSSGASYSGKITFKGVDLVPAPGALALLGIGGLVGSRRRR
jgi:hypothetical protein